MPTQTSTPPFLPGFVKANSTVKRRLIMSLEGLEGCGKTRFALTAPGPIAFINFDYGLEGVIEPFQSLKPIYVCQIKLNLLGGKDQVVTAATQELQKFESSYQIALKQARTIIVDTCSEMWELMRISAFGKLAQVLPHMYGPVNQEMTRLIKLAYDSDANLILTHRLKEQWVNDRKTGLFEFAGMRDIPYLVQCHARLWTDGDGFHLKIGKARQNASAVGVELTNQMIDFPFLASIIFPDSNTEDWQ